jgi:prepilin peptidase CpaA
MQYITLYILFCMAATLWYDVTRYTIPNWLVGSLLILYPVAIYVSGAPVDWQMAVVAMVVTFAAGYVVFATRVMGGGDVKLIAVLALWVGWARLLDYVLLFALIGGVFTLFLIVVRKYAVYLPFPKLPRVLQPKAPVPYGVAIAGAFLWFMWQGRIPMLISGELHRLV